MGLSWCCVAEHGVRLQVRVRPRARRNCIDGLINDRLLVRLNAPPLDGRANSALIKFLATSLDIPIRDIAIIKGEHHRDKVLLVRNIDLDHVQNAIAQHLPA